MAPSRGRSERVAARKPASLKTAADPYAQLLAEAENDTDHSNASSRPLKRRKIASSSTAERDPGSSFHQPNRNAASENRQEPSHKLNTTYDVQTVEDSSESDESDLEFEDVDLHQAVETASESGDTIEDISIVLDEKTETKLPSRARRKPVSIAEKAHRLLVHKLHILCILGHCLFVNGRCNDPRAQESLSALLTEKNISFLIPDPSKSQYQRNSTFLDGLSQATKEFAGHYRVTASGFVRPEWAADNKDAAARVFTEPFDRDDFLQAAKDLEGSQDVGNQLFCALLRSAGVETRIVCSLQVLSFASVPKPSTPQKPVKRKILAIASDQPPSPHEDVIDSSISASAKAGRVPAARRRIGQPIFKHSTPQNPLPRKRTKPIQKLSYPVFWTEAFNQAHQKWVPLDPIVTGTINQAQKLEPPLTYTLNQLLYAIAFEQNGVARDVTKRYAKAYNAKTRRQRVENSGEPGSKWWKKTMRIFRRQFGRIDRDQVEDAEMAQKEAREGLPSNVLDFKDHPYYALERHLKRNETIHPKREVGKVNVGTSAKPKMEIVYRRQDVLVCRSADKWYRMGREVKQGEQPIKYVAARTTRNRSLDPENNDQSVDASTTGLYASTQTKVYVPEPVKDGRIPRNVYGNLDIYVPSMVPSGGIHISHYLAQRAAKLIGIDYADAVTGFQFKGRHGTAVVEGVVVAQQYQEAVRAVIQGFEDEILHDQSRLRSLEALRAWKRFITGLRIAERVRAYSDGVTNNLAGDNPVQSGDSLEDTTLQSINDAPLLTAGDHSLLDLTRLTKPKKPSRKRVEDYDDNHDDGVEGDIARDFDNNVAAENDDNTTEHFAQSDVEDRPVPEHEFHEGGGGFLTERQSGLEAGFLSTETWNQNGDLAGGFVPPSHLDHRQPEDSQEGGGFLPEQDDDDAYDQPFGGDQDERLESRASGTDNDIEANRPDPVNMLLHLHTDDISDASIVATVEHVTGSPDTSRKLTPQATRDRSIDNKEDKAMRDADRSDDDSVISHDPDDEDAEPDWLESD